MAENGKTRSEPIWIQLTESYQRRKSSLVEKDSLLSNGVGTIVCPHAKDERPHTHHTSTQN